MLNGDTLKMPTVFYRATTKKKCKKIMQKPEDELSGIIKAFCLT